MYKPQLRRLRANWQRKLLAIFILFMAIWQAFIPAQPAHYVTRPVGTLIDRYGLAIIHTLVTIIILYVYPPDVPKALIPITWGASLSVAILLRKGLRI